MMKYLDTFFQVFFFLLLTASYGLAIMLIAEVMTGASPLLLILAAILLACTGGLIYIAWNIHIELR